LRDFTALETLSFLRKLKVRLVKEALWAFLAERVIAMAEILSQFRA